MIRRPGRSFLTSSRAALAAATFALCAMLAAHPGAAFAQASSAAADASAPAQQQYQVRPGQSLSDISGELTGSKERAVKEKMARALFEANPNAFSNHDINKLKLGSVLTVPAGDFSGAVSAPVAASAAPAPEAAAAASQSPATEPAPAESASAVAPVASAPAVAEAASEPAPAASAPASVTAAETAPPRARSGPNPTIIGLIAAVIVVLILMMISRGKKRRREEAAAAARTQQTYGSMEEAQAEAAARNDALRREREQTPRHPDSNPDGDLEGKAVERGQSELNAVAASLGTYEAAQAFATPSDDDPMPSTETDATHAKAPEAEPFVPATPAAVHTAFVPPPRDAATNESEPREPDARKWETEEREAAARQAAIDEAAERETRAREQAAREALSQQTPPHNSDAHEAAERAEAAREAAAREIIAREAELREARATEKPSGLGAPPSDDFDLDDDESLSAHRFPMPKFPTEAVQALDSLDLGLPPRLESPPAVDAIASTPKREEAPIVQQPFTPQPVAEPEAHRPTPRPELQSVASQIEAGTAGAASVAGLGATQFGPLSLDFDMNAPSSHAEPLPALTPAQLATIARNKLELATEYIELGDLSGARTLLQEVIAANDAATRPKAAALLSTLAPHS